MLSDKTMEHICRLVDDSPHPPTTTWPLCQRFLGESH